MRYYAYYLQIFLLLLGGCISSDKSNPLKLFSEHQELYHETLPSNDYVLAMTGQIVDLGGYIVLFAINNKNDLAIYDKTLHCYLPPIGPRGQGPAEFSYIKNIQFADSTRIYVHDDARKEFVDYQFTTFSNDSVQTRKKVIFSWKPMALLAVKAGNYFVRLCAVEDGMFSLADASGKELGLFEQYPPIGENGMDYPSPVRAMSYQGRFAVRPGDSLFVFVPLSAPIIQIFKAAENKIIKHAESIVSYAHPEIIKSGTGNLQSAHGRDNPFGYLSVTGTREYIYVLYSGRTFNEYQSKVFCGRDVLVFDWNCKPVKHYVLDLDVSCIEVSRDNKTLWAAADNPDPELVKYALD